MTTGSAVATNHPLAVAAGIELFKAGGNAVDAAVAAMLANCVVVPYSVSIGGYGGSLVYYDATKRAVSAIDFDSTAPYAFKPDGNADAERWKLGPLAIATPGVVAGLSMAVQKFGAKNWAEVLAPAIRLADEGFILDPVVAKAFNLFVAHADKTSLKALAPSGKFPAAGERRVQKDLAGLLRKLADDPSSFYHGEIPRAIVKQVQASGGILAEEDFNRFEAHAVEPLTIQYNGVDLYSPPPPSAGITVMSILKTLESFDLASRVPWSAPYFELFAEASKLCWDERREHLGDPDFVHPPIEQMLSEKAAHARAEQIRSGPPREAKPAANDDTSHTANVVAVGANRGMVSLTATMGDAWGSHVAIDGLGLVLGHGMSRFDWKDPKSPNAAAPGKRVLHNMAPLLMLKSSKPLGAIGAVGGPRIPSATAQLVIAMLDFKVNPAAAIAAPRIHTEGDEPLELTQNMPKPVADELELMGHTVKRVPAIGSVLNCAVLTEDGKTFTLAGSMRDGVAEMAR